MNHSQNRGYQYLYNDNCLFVFIKFDGNSDIFNPMLSSIHSDMSLFPPNLIDFKSSLDIYFDCLGINYLIPSCFRMLTSCRYFDIVFLIDLNDNCICEDNLKLIISNLLIYFTIRFLDLKFGFGDIYYKDLDLSIDSNLNNVVHSMNGKCIINGLKN